MPELDLSTLESWLYNSANILRGSIDSSDFKNYIFESEEPRQRILD